MKIFAGINFPLAQGSGHLRQAPQLLFNKAELGIDACRPTRRAKSDSAPASTGGKAQDAAPYHCTSHIVRLVQGYHDREASRLANRRHPFGIPVPLPAFAPSLLQRFVVLMDNGRHMAEIDHRDPSPLVLKEKPRGPIATGYREGRQHGWRYASGTDDIVYCGRVEEFSFLIKSVLQLSMPISIIEINLTVDLEIVRTPHHDELCQPNTLQCLIEDVQDDDVSVDHT